MKFLKQWVREGEADFEKTQQGKPKGEGRKNTKIFGRIFSLVVIIVTGIAFVV